MPYKTRYCAYLGKNRLKTLKEYGSMFNINTDHLKFKNTFFNEKNQNENSFFQFIKIKKFQNDCGHKML